MSNPVLVNAWRGNAIENRHRGAVAVVDARGSTRLALGDVQRNVFPRSAIKFLQAIPLVESGALDRLGLDERHLALACASHNGEATHADLALHWLERLELAESDLACGAVMPMHQATCYELLGQGQGPRRVYHNCSGKHLGLLSVCRLEDDPVRLYHRYGHVAQRRWFDVLEAMSSARVAQLPWGYDGCGIPSVALPLQRIALAMARFASLSAANGARGEAVARVREALRLHPYLVAGRERLCTDLMERLAPGIFVKVGADGVYTAALPEEGLGIALKIDDGNDSAARVALGATLEHLGVIGQASVVALGEYLMPSIANSRGEVIGRVEPSSTWTREAQEPDSGA